MLGDEYRIANDNGRLVIFDNFDFTFSLITIKGEPSSHHMDL